MVLYRFKETRRSESRITLTKLEYFILSKTPTGFWIEYHGRKKFVKSDAKKKFACEKEEDALESYYARKRRQISILKHQLRQAEAALRLKPGNESEYIDADFQI